MQANTLMGTLKSKVLVQLENLYFLELDKSKTFTHQNTLVFEHSCNYDMIIGRDFLLYAGMKLNFKQRQVRWFGKDVPMKSRLSIAVKVYIIDDLDDDELEYFDAHISTILDAKYNKIDPKIVAQEQKHLMQKQQVQLQQSFTNCTKLFSG